MKYYRKKDSGSEGKVCGNDSGKRDYKCYRICTGGFLKRVSDAEYDEITFQSKKMDLQPFVEAL